MTSTIPRAILAVLFQSIDFVQRFTTTLSTNSLAPLAGEPWFQPAYTSPICLRGNLPLHRPELCP